MKVSELASELNTTSDNVLKTLKSLKLKAKDSKQELNVAVISVIKSELLKGKGAVSRTVKRDEKEMALNELPSLPYKLMRFSGCFMRASTNLTPLDESAQSPAPD